MIISRAVVDKAHIVPVGLELTVDGRGSAMLAQASSIERRREGRERLRPGVGRRRVQDAVLAGLQSGRRVR